MLMTAIDLVVPALIVANVIGLALGNARVPHRYRMMAAGLGAVATFVPVGSSSPGGLYLSIFGTPSAATILLTLIFAQRLVRPNALSPSGAFVALIVVAGALLYPATAGLTVFDPYDLGFRGWVIPGLMAIAAIAGWMLSARDALVWIGLAAVLFLAGASGSHNIWDSLIDPFAWLVALALTGGMLYRATGRVRNSRMQPVKPRAG
jgi:hypothetical protein